jgi:hypothetical protein
MRRAQRQDGQGVVVGWATLVDPFVRTSAAGSRGAENRDQESRQTPAPHAGTDTTTNDECGRFDRDRRRWDRRPSGTPRVRESSR